MTFRDTLYRNLDGIRRQIAQAAEKSARDPGQIRLVAVTKTVDPDHARALHDLGLRDLGENRVQEILRKQTALADLDINWHMIGHLQTNKAKKILGCCRLIHSVDSLRLAQALSKAAADLPAAAEILLQVNVSGEHTKAGFTPEELPAALDRIAQLPGLNTTGLMTMAPFVESAEAVRPCFVRLRQLRDTCRKTHPDLRHLSMGMTQDYPVAIEEGATIIRLGTALFRAT